MSKIIEAICSGDTVLFADGAPQVLLLNTRGVSHKTAGGAYK